MYVKLQEYLAPLFVVHYVINLFGIMMPCYYFWFEHVFHVSLPWPHVCRILMWWCYAAVVHTVTVMQPYFCANYLQRLARLSSGVNLQSDTAETAMLLRDAVRD